MCVSFRLYQPSSRRPVAFSPSAEMGLTDIEMSHNLDFDDPFFDDRQYEMVYEVSFESCVDCLLTCLIGGLISLW